MPAVTCLRIWIDHPARLIVSSFSGALGMEGIRRDRELIGHDLRFDSSMRRLVDARGVTTVNLSSRELQLLGQESAYDAEAARVFLVGSDTTYAIAREAAAWYQRSRPNTRIFRDEAEAMAWLGLPENHLLMLAEPDHDETITPR